MSQVIKLLSEHHLDFNLAHRDLSLASFTITPDLEVKLIQCASSVELESDCTANIKAGTWPSITEYMPPEVHQAIEDKDKMSDEDSKTE